MTTSDHCNNAVVSSLSLKQDNDGNNRRKESWLSFPLLEALCSHPYSPKNALNCLTLGKWLYGEEATKNSICKLGWDLVIFESLLSIFGFTNNNFPIFFLWFSIFQFVCILSWPSITSFCQRKAKELGKPRMQCTVDIYCWYIYCWYNAVYVDIWWRKHHWRILGKDSYLILGKIFC